MSEMYEGIVVRGDASTVRAAFARLRSSATLRLVHFGDQVFGVYRVAGRDDAFDVEALIAPAEQMAEKFGKALAVFYDNRGGVRAATLVGKGGVRAFGEADELWVALDENGEPVRGLRKPGPGELEPDREYECVASAIDRGLGALEVRDVVSSALLKQVFCYGTSGWEAER